MTDSSPSAPRRTAFYGCHVVLQAKLVDFAGWEMPVQYPTGAVAEHLACRSSAGLFDVAHMGRFIVRGPGATALLDYALTNCAGALPEWMAQYTLLATPTGGAIDDAFCYRKSADDYLLVVNASNRPADWTHLQAILAGGDFGEVELIDVTTDLVMLALQGPASESLLSGLLTGGGLPAPERNAVSDAAISGIPATIARTGYTGERVCFELFFPADHAESVWGALVAAGATPVGLAARDTLRLEASLPLYGHELGDDADGNEIPIFASPASRLGVDLSTDRHFVGRAALEAQQRTLPKRIRSVALLGRGVARPGAAVTKDGRPVGQVTSGTVAPVAIEGAETHEFRAVALAYLDSDVAIGDAIDIDVRGKGVAARVVPGHLGGDGS